MKKVFIGVFLIILLITFLSAIISFRRFAGIKYEDGNNISLHIKENADQYHVFARYDRRKTRDVQYYLDRTLGTDHMFRKSKINATITLDDHTRFYVKNSPGRLVIRLNRDENSEEAYWRMKELAEGLKKHIISEK
jgi:preprotein translocase subunit SecF